MDFPLPQFPGSAFFKGQNLDVANTALAKLNQLAGITGGAGVGVSAVGNGHIIEHFGANPIEPPWWGITVPHCVPTGKSKDFPDARYWVQRLLGAENTDSKYSPYEFYLKQAGRWLSTRNAN